MITGKLSQWLIEQIGHELTAHQDYLGIAVHFQRQSLFGWGKLFNQQAMEEAQHATRIMTFLTDNGVEFDLPPLPGASTHFESALKAAETSLTWERSMTERFRAALLRGHEADAKVGMQVMFERSGARERKRE